MRKGQFVILLFAAFVAGLAGAWVLSARQVKSADTPATKESAYDRVMRTQTIRCGYVVWTPILLKDPNNGQLSGVFYDYTEALGHALHLKIEWTEEMGWSDFPAALQSGRIDAMCGGSNINATRGRVIDYTLPIVYQPIYAYARASDTRFDNNLDAIDDPGITVVAVEGTTPSVIAAEDFPKAKHFLIPEMTSLSESFVNVADGKADVVMNNPAVALAYDAHNPGKLHRIPAKTPLRVFGTAIAIAGGEDRFRRMLDMSTDELLGSGQIEKIVTRYEQFPGTLLRAAPPYVNPEAPH